MIKIGKTQETILDFMIAYPVKCYNTTMTRLLTELEPFAAAGFQTLYAALHRMIKRGIVTRNRHPRSSLSDFTINWNCHGLPSHILAKAPDHIKETVDATNEKLKSGEYKAIDAYGAGITRQAEPEPTEPELPAEPVVLPPLDDSPIMEAEPATLEEETPQAQPITVEPVVAKTADGRTISVTLTINLNL